LLAGLPRVLPTAVRVTVQMLGADVARSVVSRAAEVTRVMSDPPWGPLGVFGDVAADSRAFFGRDASAWSFGLGVAGRVGLLYRPVYAALRVGWTRHTSRLEDSVITPAPDLDIIGASVEGGLAWRWNTFTTRVGIVGGLEYLH